MDAADDAGPARHVKLDSSPGVTSSDSQIRTGCCYCSGEAVGQRVQSRTGSDVFSSQMLCATYSTAAGCLHGRRNPREVGARRLGKVNANRKTGKDHCSPLEERGSSRNPAHPLCFPPPPFHPFLPVGAQPKFIRAVRATALLTGSGARSGENPRLCWAGESLVNRGCQEYIMK